MTAEEVEAPPQEWEMVSAKLVRTGAFEADALSVFMDSSAGKRAMCGRCGNPLLRHHLIPPDRIEEAVEKGWILRTCGTARDGELTLAWLLIAQDPADEDFMKEISR